TSPGDFHEAANFAAVHRLPVVFVIENNLLAISTRYEKQTAVKDIADKAAAYAMPGHVADGMDVLDSYEKTKLAADHARAGAGPSLVELKCYRYQPHTSDDDDSRYRTKQEVDEWRARDPVKGGREYLLSAGVAEQELEEIRVALADEIERAIAQAESEPDPPPEDAAAHGYPAADQHTIGSPRVRLRIADVAGSPSKTVLELRRAAVEDRADAIVIGVPVDYDEAFAAAVQLAQVPVLFTLPIAEPATAGGWAFALAPTPAQLARATLDHAAGRVVLSSTVVV